MKEAEYVREIEQHVVKKSQRRKMWEQTARVKNIKSQRKKEAERNFVIKQNKRYRENYYENT